MELFGNHILDFPDDSESLFCGRLPRVSESECDLGKEISCLLDIQENWGVRTGEDSEETGENEENESVFSEGSFKSDEETKAGLELLLPSEEDFLSDNSSFEDLRCEGRPGLECDVPAAPQPHTDPDAQHSQHAESRARVGGEQHKSVPCREAGSPLTCPSSPSDQGYSSQEERLGEQQIDLFADVDIDYMLNVGKEELEEVDRVSNLISGAHCDFIEELKKSSPSPDPTNAAPLLDSLHLKEEELDCDLGQFDFNLGVAESIEMEEVTVTDGDSADMQKFDSALRTLTDALSVASPELWAECFSTNLQTGTADSTEYDDLLDSILSSPDHSLDPDYFNSEDFDIDSVDPTVLDEIKEETAQHQQIHHQEQQEEEEVKEELIKEEDIKLETEEEEAIHSSCLDHNYSLPASFKSHSPSLHTPPHSSEDDSDSESQLPYKVKYGKSLLRHPGSPRSGTQKLVRSQASARLSHSTTQVIKFQHKKDLKFVMSIEVKNDDLKSTSTRSLLKSKLHSRGGKRAQQEMKKVEQQRRGHIPSSASNRQKTAKELVREIVEKRSRVEDIETKREQVKNMKRKLRQEGKEAREEHKVKHRCYTDLRSKPDIRKYRKFEEERELHNSMERQRRVELKDAYDSLKERIPTIANEDKVSKLMILNTACDYSQSMETLYTRLRREKQAQLDRRRVLQEQVDMLRIHVM